MPSFITNPLSKELPLKPRANHNWCFTQSLFCGPLQCAHDQGGCYYREQAVTYQTVAYHCESGGCYKTMIWSEKTQKAQRRAFRRMKREARAIRKSHAPARQAMVKQASMLPLPKRNVRNAILDNPSLSPLIQNILVEDLVDDLSQSSRSSTYTVHTSEMMSQHPSEIQHYDDESDGLNSDEMRMQSALEDLYYKEGEEVWGAKASKPAQRLMGHLAGESPVQSPRLLPSAPMYAAGQPMWI